MSFWYREDFSGLPGTTIDQPLHSAELMPIMLSSERSTKFRPAAGF